MALTGIGGSLASGDLLDELAKGTNGDHQLRGALMRARQMLGPASGARQVFDLQLQPLLQALGLDLAIVRSDPAEVVATFGRGGRYVGVVSAGGWNSDLRRLRDRAAHDGPNRMRWWIGGNGAYARVMDVTRAYTRRALDLDLARLEDDDRALAVLRQLFDGQDGVALSTLDKIVAASDRHSTAVGRSLLAGVQ